MAQGQILIDESSRVLRGALVLLGVGAMLMVAAGAAIGSLRGLLTGQQSAVLFSVAVACVAGSYFLPRLRVWHEPVQQQLLWQRRQGKRTEQRTFSLKDPLQIGITTHTERDDDRIGLSTSYRLVLITNTGSYPLSIYDEPNLACLESRADALRRQLGLAQSPPADATDELDQWLARGGPFEAIHQLRRRDGLTLEEATRRVHEHRSNPPTRR